jgi:hypothetical protein
MKGKVIFVNILIMLLICNVLAGALNITYFKNKNPVIIANENDAELPVWKNGDSWTYDITMTGRDNSGDISFDLSMTDLKFTVIDTSGDYYKLNLNGEFSGSGSYMGVISGQIHDGTLTGEQFVNKADLGNQKIENLNLNGKITILDLDVDIDNMFFNPIYTPIQFPLNVGDTWNVPTNIMNLEGYINKPSVVEGELSMELHAGGYVASCNKKENKQGYESIKITQNSTNSWYAPDAGNVVYAKNSGIIKLFMWGLPDYFYEITFFEMKLKDTNYEPPNDPPDTPITPYGETGGRAGVEYSYCTSGGEDPNNHQVQYGFDWNGDNSVDDWTNLVGSGEESCINHAFSSDGTYRIKAKTRDSIGAESGWSPELTVHMDPNNVPETPDTPSGPNQGIVGIEYTYSTNTVIDPDGDDIAYEFDWGDGKTSTSLTTPSASHIWTTKGNFVVKVRAKDEYNAASDWSGGLEVFMDNTAPEKPDAPDGPKSGRKNTQLSYSTSTTDPEGHRIYYKFDWGDGSDSGWLGPENSGEIFSASNSWADKGDYTIKVKAKDEYGEETEWSDPLSISIPRYRFFKLINLEKLFEKYPFIEKLFDLLFI